MKLDVASNVGGSECGRDSRQPLGWMTPLIWRDVVEAMEAQGAAGGTAMSLLAVLGMSSQTYGDETTYKQANKAKRKELFGKYLTNMEWDTPDPAYSKFLTKKQMEQVDSKREEKKQSVIAEALTPDPEKPKPQSQYRTKALYEKAVERYPEAIEERKKAREKFKEMLDKLKLSFDQAQQLLYDYYQREVGHHSSNTSYHEKAVMLAKMYGRGNREWREWWDNKRKTN